MYQNYPLALSKHCKIVSIIVVIIQVTYYNMHIQYIVLWC